MATIGICWVKIENYLVVVVVCSIVDNLLSLIVVGLWKITIVVGSVSNWLSCKYSGQDDRYFQLLVTQFFDNLFDYE